MDRSKINAGKNVAVALLKVATKFALTVAAFDIALAYLFDFTSTQALGLGLALTLAIDIAASRKAATQAKFTPHRLSIQFHVGRALLDLKLVPGDEQWKELIQSIPESDVWNVNSVYRRFVVGYVIGASPALIHYPDLRSYSEMWRAEFKLESITFGDADSLWSWSPELYVRPGIGGYHVGVRVHEKWWETNKGAVAEGIVLSADKEYQFGTVRLSLAILPYDITAVYYRDTSRDHQEAIKEKVAKQGWENEGLGMAEVGYFGEGYTHRYATVWAQHLAE